MKIKRVLITGTTGFLGFKALSFFLKNNYWVTDLIRKKNKKLNAIRKIYKYKYQSIIINNNFQKKLKLKKFDYVINFATFYKKEYKVKDIQNLINSNIVFCYEVLKNTHHSNLVFINFGSMMEYQNNVRSPKNIYAASKIFFEEISLIFKIKKQYNIKIYETFDINDRRKKIIPEIIKSYKNNKKINLMSKKIVLNFISTENIFNFLTKILNNKINPGSYLLMNKNFININTLLKKIKKKFKIKIKIKRNEVKNNSLKLKKIIYLYDLEKKLIDCLNAK